MKSNHTRKVFLFLLIILCMLPENLACAADDESSAYFFFSTTCSDCKRMNQYLKYIVLKNPQAKIRFINIEEDRIFWEKTCTDYGVPVWGVPRIFIGDKVFAGWFKYEGKLQYLDSFYGYVGYYNQIKLALEDFFQKPIIFDSKEFETFVEEEDIIYTEDCDC